MATQYDFSWLIEAVNTDMPFWDNCDLSASEHIRICGRPDLASEMTSILFHVENG
jgi:hypothetical protein